MDDDEICYECTGYGDDYYVDENGEMRLSYLPVWAAC